MRILICTVLMMLMSVSAFARNHVWYDKNAGISTMKKIVVFPIEGTTTYQGAYGALTDNLSKRIKNIHFTVLQPGNAQASRIMATNDRLAALLGDFPSEEARAQAVQEATAADAYLICRVREDRVQQDWSPETECAVTIEEYTEETGGPDGTRRYDTSSYVTTHVVPGQYVYLHLLNLDYALYDDQGRKIMLVQNNAQGYGCTQEGLYKDLFKEFSKELKVANKDKGK